MLTHFRNVSGWMAISVAVLTFLFASSDVTAQIITRNNRAVGGIFCDTDGYVGNTLLDERGKLVQQLKQGLQAIPVDLKNPIPLEAISLRGLGAAIEKHGDKIPDDIKYLGGLQQIRYIFVYPDKQDIVLVGPAEGWKVNDKGYVVGITTGRPVMLLDDLLVALRTARKAAEGGISCSIDPTKEGLERLRVVSSRMKTRRGSSPQQAAAMFKKALGNQKITFTGVPDTSHFARVLVAGDYRMKRLAMGFEEPPVKGLPSFLKMIPGGGDMLPRWWLEPNYQPMLHSADRLAWEIRDAGVKAMTEADFLAANGNVKHSGKAHPLAQKWADNMTAKFSELSVAEPIFGQLRNCMELAIVSALIVKEDLPRKANYSMPILMNPAELQTTKFNAPKEADSQVSMLRKRGSWVFGVSGGVLVNSWAIADKMQQSDAPTPVRMKIAPKGNNWRWN